MGIDYLMTNLGRSIRDRSLVSIIHYYFKLENNSGYLLLESGDFMVTM